MQKRVLCKWSQCLENPHLNASCYMHFNFCSNCFDAFATILITITFVLDQTVFWCVCVYMRVCVHLHTIQRRGLFICPVLASDAPTVRCPVVVFLLVLDQDLPHQLLGAW